MATGQRRISVFTGSFSPDNKLQPKQKKTPCQANSRKITEEHPLLPLFVIPYPGGIADEITTDDIVAGKIYIF